MASTLVASRFPKGIEEDHAYGVYILSDNRLFRESLARIFSHKSDIRVVSSKQFSPLSAEEVLNSNAEILILDSAAFLFSESARLQRDRFAKTAIKILLVAMEEDERLFLQTVRWGTMGFVPKEASAMDVVAAVRSVANGEAVCPPRLCKFLFDFVAQQDVAMPNGKARFRLGLTRREQQLIPLIGRGLTNKEIAAHLNLSEQTVKNHVHRILRKVGVENRLCILEACRTQEIRI